MTASTKEHYLGVAASMVVRHVADESAHVHLAGHIRLTEVADRLGVSRSSLYRLWPSQLDFWHDVVELAVSSPSRVIAELVAEPTDGDAAADPSTDLEALVRTVVAGIDDAVVGLTTDPSHLLRAGLAGYPPSSLVPAAAAVERSERAAAADRLARMLAGVGRRPLPPLTTDDLVTAMGVFLDGAVLYGRSVPESLDHRVVLEADGTAWSLTGLAVRSLLVELTEPGKPVERRGPTPGRAIGTPDRGQLPLRSALHAEALEAALELLVERAIEPRPQDLEAALGHVSLARLARAAGVTRRHMYHLWSSQSEFLFDLLDRMVAEERADFVRRLDSSTVDAAAVGDRSRLLLVLIDELNAYRRSETPPRPAVRLALQPHIRGEWIDRWKRAGMARTVAINRQRVDLLAAHLSMRPLAGVDADDVATIMVHAAAGSERLHRVDPRAIRYDIPWRGGHHSSFAIAVQAIGDHLMVAPSE